ncbi:oxidase [Acidianus sulfidivorans JP7]|uniref:Oxidase n=1 Tax=Acidianus sulfidivorans JP7 TaxID=619593 RepID=A0A2U9ILY6_9CREN|nr:oxidase [Acidianus sulfidivorans]AWR97079.1 oxidase [Acidianus sulfidivorans JP7]
MDKKERWELIWTLFVIILFAVVIVSTVPLDFTVGGVPSVISELNGVSSSKIVNVYITSCQYLFRVNESGGGIESNQLGSPYYYNLIVGHPGQYLNITMKSADVTSNFYFADYADRVVTDQIVPGLVAYDVLPVPNISGAYAFVGGEYNGPWFSYQSGLLLSIPYSGYISPSNISAYEKQTSIAQTVALKGDPYNPPIVGPSNTFTLVGDQYGIFNASVPGPTLITTAHSTVTVKMYLPMPDDDRNYLYNYSVSGTPYPVTNVEVGIYAVWWNGTITLVKEVPVQYNTYMSFTFNATAPAYLYGIITPVYYNYNPDALSSSIGSLIGIQKGYVMGAWGVILVEE